MTFLATWSLRPEMHKSAGARFLQNGAQPPNGIKTIGRWHYVDGSGGIHVIECDDASLMIEFAEQWNDLIELHIRPLVDDAVAGAALKKHSGSA